MNIDCLVDYSHFIFAQMKIILFSSLLFSSLLFSSQIFFIVPSSQIISFHILLLWLSLLAYSLPNFILMSGLFSHLISTSIAFIFLPFPPLFPFPFQFPSIYAYALMLNLCSQILFILFFPHTLRSWESWLLFVICHVSVFFHKSRRDMLCSPAERNLLSVCSAC